MTIKIGLVEPENHAQVVFPFIVAIKTENNVFNQESNPGIHTWEATTLALSHAHITS